MTLNTTKIKEFFIQRFDKKTLIRKGIIAAAALALVLIFSLSFYFWLRGKDEGTIINQNGFWFIHVTWNKGVAFGGMKGNLAGILAIQSVVFVLMVAIYMFLAQDTISCAFIACAMFGGLFNLIQRGCTPNLGVLDYFQFGFWPNFAIFNWPDMFVVCGIFGFIISFIVYLFKQEDKEDERQDEQAQTMVPPASETPVSVQE